jgi:hypothetical protein
MDEIDLAEIDDFPQGPLDYRRANGAPMVSNPEDPEKWERYSRPSGYAKCLDDEQSLVTWRIWKAMQGTARSQALQAKINVCKEEDKETKKALRDEALDKGTANEKADMGTGLHAMTARAEDPLDVDFDPPEQYVPDLDAYMDCLATYGLKSEMVEVPMVNDDFRAAGTADRIYRLTLPLQTPDGTWLQPGDLVLGDLKTGAKLDFSLPGYCVQMALYATGVLYDLTTNRRIPTPPICQTWTLLVHLPFGSGRCKLLWCPIDTGLKGALHAYDVKQWRKEWKRGSDGFDAIEVALPVEDNNRLEPMIITPEREAALQEAEDADADVMTEMTLFALRRVKAISDVPQAKSWLIMHWPEGLRTPKQGYTDAVDLVTCLNLLDECEKQFSLPFLRDPRDTAGQHQSQLDRSNNRDLVES